MEWVGAGSSRSPEDASLVLARWFAANADLGDGVPVEPEPEEFDEDAEWETWGTSPDAVAGQNALLALIGGPLPVPDPAGAVVSAESSDAT